ncbi:MAG TPA: lysine biosynthesis protein LysW [Aggregatilineales bacterium]|nr:lysine biosynthesis protein LysW [Aggregatilineales bacterium]
MSGTCPECEASITLDKPMRGEIVSCPECGAELEVTSVSPITLELAPMTEEDYGE